MKNIKIQNFQSHKNTELNLHPNVNIIVGQSSSGKTAIFRAIEWLNTNRPLGTRFISHGERKSEVTIDDITGIKTDKGKTSFTVLGRDTFDSGSNVPDLVVQSLNLSEDGNHARCKTNMV
jgi:DNA repair ATPase RecN